MVSSKTFFKTSSFIFCVVGFLHLSRIFTGYGLSYAGFEVPVWLSFIAGIFLWWLSYNAYKLGKRK